MNTQATILVQSLGWALLHSLWQGLLIYCCLRIVLKISGTVSSRLKYHLSVAALAGSFVWFINTCIAQYQRLQGITIHITQSGADPAATKTYALTTLPTHTTNGKLLNSIIAGIEPFFPVLVGFYIAGIGFLLLKLVVNLVQVKNLRHKGITTADAYWTEWIQQWQAKLDISRKVQLFFSEKISVPMTMGALKPIILLPIASLNNLAQDQLEAILLHELAHIKRHDYLLNIIQTVVETILFFNPFIWLISRIIRKEREHCCDDVVMTYMNTPLPYAKALAELEVQRFNKMAMAATGNKNQLLNRIKRIMEMKKKPVNYTQFGVAAILILALIVSIAWFSPVMAQTKKTVAKDKKGNKTVTKTVTTKNGKKTTAHTIIIEKDIKDNHGVHPKDVGNAEDMRKNMEEALSHINFGEEGNNDIKEAIANIDWEGIGNNAQNAIAKVDWDKIGDETSVAMASINWDEIDREIKKAGKDVKNVDWNEINKEIAEATKELKDVDWDEVNKNMKKGKGTRAYVINMKDGSMTSQTSTSNISVNGNDFNTMLDQMEKDGTIDRDKGFNLDYKNGILRINGEKLTGAKAEKYMKYLEDESHTTISGSKNNTSINVDINR
jgi:bla regulator protein BlaR1